MPGQKVHGRSTLVLDWIQTAWYQCAEITFPFCCPIIHPAMLRTLCFLSPLGDLLSIFQNTSNAVLSLMLLPSSACPSLQVPRFDSCPCQFFFFSNLSISCRHGRRESWNYKMLYLHRMHFWHQKCTANHFFCQ